METVGNPEVTPSTPAQKKYPKPAGGWAKGDVHEYNPDSAVFKDFEIETDEYVKRFMGRKEFKATESKKAVTPTVDGVFQTPVLFREGGRYQYRWRPVRVRGSMDLYRQYLESGQGRAKQALESSGDPFDRGGGGGSQFFSNTPGSPTQLIDANDFVPFLNGPFYKQLYQYDYLLMHARCLVGTTPIPLLDGTTKPISEVKVGEWVYSCSETGMVVPGRVTASKKTGVQEQVIKVTLDNGESVTCTSDHLFMLRDGQYRQARELHSGDSLMPLYRKYLAGYESVYHPGVALWEPTHRRVVLENEGFKDWPGRQTTHHKNSNKRDNRPENLELLTWEQHIAVHKNDPEFQAHCKEKFRLSNLGKKRSESTRALIAAKARKRWKDPDFKNKVAAKISIALLKAHAEGRAKTPRNFGRRGPWSDLTKAKISIGNRRAWTAYTPEQRAARNHKVVEVQWLTERHDVYDLTIDKYHNFAVGQGIFVHNSFQLVNHAALAAGAVKIMTRFVLGRGISFSIKNHKAQAIWEDFWDRNGMRDKVRQMARDLCWQGELMLRFYEREPGRLTMRIIDPSTCWEIVTDPEDFEHVYYYHFQWPCLRGDVKISGLDGQEIAISDLAEKNISESAPFWVYSYDEESGKVVPGKATKCWKAGTKRCVEVELDNGEKVVSSWDHPFLLRSGQYVHAEDLKPGDSLMPLYRRTGYEQVWHPGPDVIGKGTNGWWEDAHQWEDTHRLVAVTVRPAGEHVVYDLQVEKYHNFALTAGVFTHNTPYQLWTQGQIPISKYIIQEVPPTNVQHIKINVSSQEKRGRSDLLPAMPWLKRFDDFYNGAVVKAVLEANLVYKVKIHGDQNDIDTVQNDPQFTILPPPGGTWLENDAVDMTPLSAVMTAGRGAMGVGQQIASIVATSLNLPTEYFNIEGGAGGARATALVRTDPAVKAVEDRQQILRESLEDTYIRVMEAAIREGWLDASDTRGEPEIVPDEGQAGEELNGRDLAFGGSAHAPRVPSRAVIRG